MTKLIAIVEGDGEVVALPILVRRLAERFGRYDVEVLQPLRIHREKFLRRDDEFRRMLELAQAKASGGTVFVLLDADDDCPVDLAALIRKKAAPVLHAVQLAVVVANREYEAWLLASAESIGGRRGLLPDLSAPPNCDSVRDAKGWLSERIPTGRYREVTDQPALTAVFDLDLALERSRSFQKFVKELESAISD